AQYLPSDMPAKHGWGHSLVDEALELGRRAEARTLALHHHDPWRDDAALDRIADHARGWTWANAPELTAHVANEGLVLELGATTSAHAPMRMPRSARLCGSQRSAPICTTSVSVTKRPPTSSLAFESAPLHNSAAPTASAPRSRARRCHVSAAST